MENTDAIRIAEEFLDAFNAGDWSRFRARMAPDVTYQETGTGRSTAGADAYVTLCQGWKEAFPDAVGRLRRCRDKRGHRGARSDLGRYANRTTTNARGNATPIW